jgi:transposase
VGNETHFVAVPAGREAQSVREFGSWTSALEEMAQWLLQCRVRTVVMQATGVYWVAVHDVLERHGLQVWLVDARGTKSVPGRKSDVQECQWLLKLHTYGLLRRCFIAPAQIHGLRTVSRLRAQHVRDAGRAVQHMQKALTEMNVQLGNVISDLSGVTGQAIVRAIVAGERNPRALAGLRDRRIAASEEEIMHSLQGNWKEDVLFALSQAVEAYDFCQKQIAACDQQLQRYLAALPSRELAPAAEPSTEAWSGKECVRKARKPVGNEPAFDLAAELDRVLGVKATGTIPGIEVMTVHTVVSEVGTDLSAWRSERHWCSWLNLAPKRDVSGRKVIRHVRTHHTNRVGNAFRMAAQSLLRSNSYLGAKYRYFRAKMGAIKACKAMARILACLYYRLVTRGQAWFDRGAAEFERRQQQRELASLQRKAQSLGMKLVAAA